MTSTDWANLEVSGSVQGVTINSPPEITFQLTDGTKALEGLDLNKSKAPVGQGGSTTYSRLPEHVDSYMNIAFSIAKLVPGSNGSPSKWVSYIVTDMPVNSAGVPVATRPTTDNTGTLTYLGNGQYKYKFYRDIKLVKDIVAASPETATNKNADLGDLTYDPTLIHRVVIQVSGNARGTGSGGSRPSYNTPDGSATGATAAVPIRTPVDIVFDWIPATGRVVKATDTDVEQREIVNIAACASCHNKFTFHGGNALTGVGGSRQETRMCVVCHTDQRKYGRANSVPTGTVLPGSAPGVTPSVNTYRVNDKSLLDLPTMVHKIHMGEELVMTGYNIAGVFPNEIKYPQLIKNCTKCHDGSATKPDGTANTITKQDGSIVQKQTTQGDNWKNKPNRNACGACHDGIDFATGTGTTLAGAATGHGAGGVGGAQANDSACSTCHTPDAIKTAHSAVTKQDMNSTLFLNGGNANTNSAWLASNHNNLPKDAIKVTYDIKSVARNSSMQPVMVFRILQQKQPTKDDPSPVPTRVDFNTPPAAGTASATLSNLEMWNNFMGSPSAYFVFAVPQDGITAPSDFNASVSGYLRSIWNGKATGTGAGTLTGPDANGYYTVTLTGVTIPDSAVMLTGGLGYSYNPTTTMPLTQTNLAAYPTTAATATISAANAHHPNKTGGLLVIAPDAQTVASSGAAAGGTGGAYTGRRAIVEDARCNNCHQELGAFNEAAFHAGQRNDGTTCSWCHTPNRTSSGWSADSTNFVHAIHGALKRKSQFTWHAASTTEGFWKIGYPGVLKNCEACHLPGSYDFSGTGRLAAAAKKQYRYTATGIFNGTAGVTTKSYSGTTCSTAGTSVQTAAGAYALSPWLPAGATNNATFFGLGFTFNAAKAGGSNSTLCDLAASPTGGAGAVVTVAPQAIRNADAATLVESPLSTVCFACHDDTATLKPNIGNVTARAHMEANGGVIYGARGAAATLTNNETCLTTCHAPTSATNIRAVHTK